MKARVSHTEELKKSEHLKNILQEYYNSEPMSYYEEEFIKQFESENKFFKNYLNAKTTSFYRKELTNNIEEYILYSFHFIIQKFLDKLSKVYLIKYGLILGEHTKIEEAPQGYKSYNFDKVPGINRISFSLKTNVNSYRGRHDLLELEYSFSVDLKRITTKVKRKCIKIPLDSNCVSFLEEIENYLFKTIYKNLKEAI